MKKLLMLVLIAAMHSFGAELPSVTIRLYNYAEVKTKILAAATKETSRIFRQAGVELRWIDCPTVHAERDLYPACLGLWKDTDLTMRIMPDAMVGKQEASVDTLGSAIGCDAGPCSVAGAYYNRVMKIEDVRTAPASIILARVMSHELGHILLGVRAHSAQGVMRGSWSEHELSSSATPEMIFTTEQSLRMKTRLRNTEVARASAQGVY